MRKSLALPLAIATAASLWAQHVPAPAGPQFQPVLISGATAHLGNGQVIEHSLVAFEEGKITFVGQVTVGRGFPGHRVIEATGLHLYPGLIATNTSLGLTEIGAVRATRDQAETGSLNPNVRALIAYNTDSEILPTVRSMGVLLAQITPAGGTISGKSSVLQLDAWNWEDAAYRPDEGIHLNWPNRFRFRFRTRRVEKNKDYEKDVRELKAFFAEAQAYLQTPDPETTNLKFEAMRELFEGSATLYIHADLAAEIEEAVEFAREFHITPVIVGGRESWMVADFLAENQVPVILEGTQNLPRLPDEDIDQPFKTPAMLQEAGVLFAIAGSGNWAQRNLPFQAGQAVPYGLEREQALQAITLNPARILGIAERTGSIEVGKDANLILCQGDLLDMRSSKVLHAFIQGREINLDNKQEMLYRKFKSKYRQGR